MKTEAEIREQIAEHTKLVQCPDEQLDKKAIELKNAMLFIFEEIKE